MGSPKRTHLYISVAILNILYLICGTTFVWSSPVLVKLTLTDTEGSTVASMLSLGSVLGPFVSGAVLDSLGRKYTVGLAMALETASYLTLAEGSGVIVLSVGRFLGGVACGMAFSALPMYIAEISEDSARGFLNTLNQISVNFGSLLMYSLGPYISYADLHYIMLGICGVFFLLFPLLPQSPYSLLKKNKVCEARDTLLWLREGSAVSQVERELLVIQGGLGIFFLLKSNQFDLDSLKWMPLLSVVSYGLFFNTGFANIPWALTGELFPSNIRPVATAVIASTCGVVAFLTTKLFPNLIALMGVEFVFMSCSLFCGLALVFIALVVQDTSGLSFVEIQEVLNGRRVKHVNRPV
ncbi:facilitated trehalose transporter Tret1-like isoform X1 [Homalodisca vitripennis]|uniref:facilitated trehalose transporter Tret1-like isoform X1 n=1 Tax=Homalodisca vitripennis TaxID=197043 RepID=UPI001EEBCF1C|nr:facilitated trehalose transporter Tret1-like isoform X1 [Homalodisca vitripennis]XP_046667411.1 facilitated trehalose transporter Tret1-like isoform X2 [Homalodisca vitripennis]XP_046667412.1 facilitated trehalose transporter Tret1-like isoform X1 [Homalodisca vitripennis]